MPGRAINPSPSAPWADVTEGNASSRRTVIGKPPSNHWMHSASPALFDLTRPSPPYFPPPSASSSITLKTTTTPILISPELTALIVIDMQNFFLSTALGRPPDSAGNKAKAQLLKNAIPAAREAGIRIVWLNWGLTDDDIDTMPPSTRRAFGFETSLNCDAVIDVHGVNEAAAKQVLNETKAQRAQTTTTTASAADIDASQLTENGKPKRLYRGLGSEIGQVELEDGTTVDGGRLLMRETWNASLPPSLLSAYEDGTHSASPDVWIHKDRMSGLWGASTPATEFLEKAGIRTLLFTGVNTDQCVGGSLMDAFQKGWDCIMLSDACGTTSPKYAQECFEYNCARTWGFVTDSLAFKNGVDTMIGRIDSKG